MFHIISKYGVFGFKCECGFESEMEELSPRDAYSNWLSHRVECDLR